MPRCDLRIELADGVDHVSPGGDLDIIVHVDCDGEIKCKALTVTRLWRTHGKGNRDSGAKEAFSVFSGTLEAGSHAFPATVSFPATPESYHGEAVNVDWYLEARADVPFKLDPKAETTVLMVNTDPPRPYEAPDVWSPAPIKLGGGMMGCMIPSVVGLVIAGLLIWKGYEIPAALLGALCLYGIYASRVAKNTAQKLGYVALEVHPSVVAPGETVTAMLEIRPEAAMEITSVRATLQSTEKATSGSGSDTTTYLEHPVKLEETAATNVHLDPLSTFEHEFTFALPVETPPTFEASDNELSTVLTLHVDVSGRRELHHAHTLTIQSTAPQS